MPDPYHDRQQTLGAVVIGRNEGDRLRRCLESLRGQSQHVVYVDSGSQDGSVALGRSLSDSVVELDVQVSFTAARARNAGFERLLQIARTSLRVLRRRRLRGRARLARQGPPLPGRACRLRRSWGMRRELHPGQSVYNLLCDIEWRGYALGETQYFGGDVLLRVKALRAVQGYRADLICGEEPELAVRLRQQGWRCWHSDDAMTAHDAAITHFGQWWTRTLRGGYGAAQAVSLHGGPPEYHGVRQCASIWSWGFALPVATLLLVPVTRWSALLLAAYPLQVVRLAMRRRLPTARENWLHAGALVLGKFAELQGQLRFLSHRLRGMQSKLIEYK